MGTEWKKSRYAFFIEQENGAMIIYHSTTGFILQCTEPEYIEKAQKIANQSAFEMDEGNDLMCLLRDKGVLLENDFDEDAQIRQLYDRVVMHRNQLSLTLIVTRQCNFRCVYCGQKHESNKRMSREIYDRVLLMIEKTCHDKKIDSVSISFFGGEPLLECEGILYFLEKLQGLSKKTGIPYYAGMTTNAYLLTKNNFERLAQLNCLDYQITLDGMDETHDKKRYLIGKRKTWKTIVDNLLYIKSTDYPFKIILRTNFDTEVLQSVDSYLNFVSENLNDDRILMYHETIKDHGNPEQNEYMSQSEAILSNVEISRLLKEKGLKSSLVFSSTTPACSMCRAGIPDFYVIDYDGSIKRCTHRLDTEPNYLGNLSDDGSMIIDPSLDAKWIYRDYLSDDECKECKLLPLCFGKQCPVARVDPQLEFDCNKDLCALELEEILRVHL